MGQVEKILHLMEAGGVNAKKLTADLGLAVSSITDWKKGKASPSVDAIVKIAQYFKVTTDYLLYDDVLPIRAPLSFTNEEVMLVNRSRELQKSGESWSDVSMRLSLSPEALKFASRWDVLDDDGQTVVGNVVIQEERRMAEDKKEKALASSDAKVI